MWQILFSEFIKLYVNLSTNFFDFGRGSTKNQAEKGKGREQGLEEK